MSKNYQNNKTYILGTEFSKTGAAIYGFVVLSAIIGIILYAFFATGGVEYQAKMQAIGFTANFTGFADRAYVGGDLEVTHYPAEKSEVYDLDRYKVQGTIINRNTDRIKVIEVLMEFNEGKDRWTLLIMKVDGELIFESENK